MRQLTDVDLRSPHLQRELPAEVLDYVPDEQVRLDKNKFLNNLRSLRRGLSGGLSGHRNEHLKLCLDDEGAADEDEDAPPETGGADGPDAPDD